MQLAKFEYTDLPESGEAACRIRLLRIEGLNHLGQPLCSIRQTSTLAKYTALSYRWGAEDAGHEVILRDENDSEDKQILVRQNLFAFLLIAAKIEPEVSFWIDAICINQQNIHERNSQVARMGEIYARAQDVRIWLGDDDFQAEILSVINKLLVDAKHSRGECYCALAYREPERFNSKILLETLPDELHLGQCPFRLRIASLFGEDCPTEHVETFKPERKSAFLQNEYWTRTWIVQEIMLAEKVLVQCRGVKTDLSHIDDLHFQEIKDMSPHMQRLLSSVYNHGPLSQGIRIRDFELESVLYVLDGSRCSEALDQIYGLRALVKDGDKIKVDYRKTAAQLFIETIEVFKLDWNDSGASPMLLSALGLNPETLVEGIQVSELWRTQKVLSNPVFSRILSFAAGADECMPACNKSLQGPCRWSLTGESSPCSDCEKLGAVVTRVGICTDHWEVEIRRLAEEDPELLSSQQRLKDHFKVWIAQTWPDELEAIGAPLAQRGEIFFEHDLPESTLTFSEAFVRAEQNGSYEPFEILH